MSKAAKSVSEQVVGSSASQADVCNYIADMALELRSLCKQHELGYLSYLMEIVFIEATEQSTRMNTAKLKSADQGNE